MLHYDSSYFWLAGETKMARGHGISLSLVIGVDCSHPWWLDLSLFFSFFFFFFSFFFVICQIDENGHWGWSDLSPLAVGVDRGHPQRPNLSLFFFPFFFVVLRRDENGHWGWPDLSPLAAKVDRGHSQWLDLLLLLFFFFWFIGKVTGDGGGWRRLFARGGRWVTVGGSIWALGVLISF
jgi:hypothetical protein